MEGERIAKVIARSGICSRRDAEKLIEAGEVKVNGARITTPALNVTPGDIILVRGKKLPEQEAARLWLYYKPVGLITSHRDEKDRPTVFSALPKDLPRVISVGRLDLNTEGLLLLTNDGALARHMELPSTGWKRRYRARIYGALTPESIASLKRGVTVEGVKYGPVEVVPEKKRSHIKPAAARQAREADARRTASVHEVHADSSTAATSRLPTAVGFQAQTRNFWAMVTLTEGKNREIRKVFEHIGCKVSRLIRVSYGPFQLGGLKPAELREVPRKVINEQVGKNMHIALGGSAAPDFASAKSPRPL